MQIVIEIPEWFKEMIDKGKAPLEFPLFLAYGIQQGIVLPKGHGRIGDLDVLRDEVSSWGMNDYEPSDFVDAIDEAPTIIEADRSEE